MPTDVDCAGAQQILVEGTVAEERQQTAATERLLVGTDDLQLDLRPRRHRQDDHGLARRHELGSRLVDPRRQMAQIHQLAAQTSAGVVEAVGTPRIADT